LAADPQASGYAETALRAAILAGDTQAAWAWVEAGGDKLKIWQLVLAAADPSRFVEVPFDEETAAATLGTVLKDHDDQQLAVDRLGEVVDGRERA
jgi:hypothetical protein